MSYNRWMPPRDELYHHGVKGMRWGVRKQAYSSDKRLRKWEKQYAREERRLVKLKSYADRDTQRKNIDVYNQRSAKATKVAVKASIAAAGTLAGNLTVKGVNSFLQSKALTKLRALNEEYDQLMDYAYDTFYKLCLNDRQAYTPDGKWTGKGYSKAFDKAVDALQEEVYAKSDRISTDMHSITTKYNATAKVLKMVAGATGLTLYAAAGVAGASAGYAVYNKIQAKHAKERLTSEGHKKAVQDVKDQARKLEEMQKQKEELLRLIEQETRRKTYV